MDFCLSKNCFWFGLLISPKSLIFLALLGWTGFNIADTKPIVALPSPPTLTPVAEKMITDGEGYDYRPTWAGGSSGVDVGYGYDMGYYSSTVIRQDWRALPQLDCTRLAAVSGITGRAAERLIKALHDIFVEKGIGTAVFRNVDVAREYASCKKAFPGFEKLRPNAQGALISLTFNRGSGMTGPNRLEMRNIRDYGVPKQDYDYMADQLRKMSRVWRGTAIEAGMKNRRYAEAKLMLTL
jgi:hypothetical protein